MRSPIVRSPRTDSATFVALASAGGLLGAAALVTAFRFPPPLIRWITLGAVLTVVLAVAARGTLAVVLALAGRGTLAVPRTRTGTRLPVAEGDTRLLVVADPRCSETLLCDEIQARLDGPAAVHLNVLVPVPRAHDPTDVDSEEHRDAAESLLISVGVLQQRGVPATGSVGGHDPLEAIVDALVLFPATQVLLAVPPDQALHRPERERLAKERALATIEVAQVLVAPVRPEAEQRDHGRRGSVAP